MAHIASEWLATTSRQALLAATTVLSSRTASLTSAITRCSGTGAISELLHAPAPYQQPFQVTGPRSTNTVRGEIDSHCVAVRLIPACRSCDGAIQIRQSLTVVNRRSDSEMPD